MNRIDWDNLGFLPDRRHKPLFERERLAETKHQRDRAKHRGRNHITNQKRRQQMLQALREQANVIAKRNAEYRRYKDSVRAYWLGLLDHHP